jgi:protein-S-isoprenylcysteine O-methyltransferase Ste14
LGILADCNRHTRQWGANLALAGWLGADGVRFLLFARDLKADLADGISGVLFLIAAAFVLRRARPRAQDTRLGAVIVALAATVLPVLLAWLAPAQAKTGGIALVVQVAAVLMMGAGLLYLRSNFSVLPQYRTVVTGGPYALVRHPIYGSYLIFDGALTLEAGSWLAGILWLAEGLLLLARARLEERLLMEGDEAYARYLLRVSWRFVPGVV